MQRRYVFPGVLQALRFHVTRRPGRMKTSSLVDISQDRAATTDDAHDIPAGFLREEAPDDIKWWRTNAAVESALRKVQSPAKRALFRFWYLSPERPANNQKKDLATLVGDRLHISRRSVYSHLSEVLDLVEREMVAVNLIPDPQREEPSDEGASGTRAADRSGWVTVEVRRPRK